MINTELTNYIKEQAFAGLSRIQIKKALLDAGWLEEDIDEGFTALIDAEQLPASMRFEQNNNSRFVIKKFLFYFFMAVIAAVLAVLLWQFAQARLV